MYNNILDNHRKRGFPSQIRKMTTSTGDKISLILDDITTLEIEEVRSNLQF